MTTTLNGTARRVISATIAVVAAMATLLLASPAQAATATYIHPEWIDGCPGCPGPVFLEYAVVRDLDLREADHVGELVVTGTQLLVGAKRASAEGDDRQAAALVREGIATFTEASNAVGYAEFRVAEYWDGDWCGNSSVKPHPKPHLFLAAEGLIADGLTTLGEAAQQRDPETQQDLQARASAALLEGAGQLAPMR